MMIMTLIFQTRIKLRKSTITDKLVFADLNYKVLEIAHCQQFNECLKDNENMNESKELK